MADEASKAEVSKPQTYHVWITALLSAYEKGIIHGLVGKGYTVSAADYNGALSYTFHGAAATLVSLKLGKEKIVPSELMDDVRAVLTAMNAKFYSIVVSKYTVNCTWVGTNIAISPEKILETKLTDKKSN
jgi:hypothetical protein